MSRNPKVSIITPFLNAGKFIEETVRSVLAQDYENWELMLVDDGSNDRSTAVAQTFARQHPGKIFYLEHHGHENRGAAASRNLGIDHCQGELIAFLDADDVWLPEKLSRQVMILEQNPDIGLIFNRMIYWYEDGSREPVPATLAAGRHPERAWINEILGNLENNTTPSTVMTRRKNVVETGGFEDSFQGLLQLFEDAAVWFKISLRSPVYYDPACTVLYRVHDASCWRSRTWDEKLLALTHLFSWFIQYLKKYNYQVFAAEVQKAMTFRLNLAKLRYFVDSKHFLFAEALRLWTELQLGVVPADATWNYLTAYSLHSSERNAEEALDRYTRALQSGYDEFWVRYNRGSLYAQMGSVAEARRDLERALELNPGQEGARQVLRQLPVSEGQRWYRRLFH